MESLTPKKIADDILSLAKTRQQDPATASSDLVAAIHGLWMEVGLLLGQVMERLRREEMWKS